MHNDEKNVKASSGLPGAEAVLKCLPSWLQTVCCGGSEERHGTAMGHWEGRRGGVSCGEPATKKPNISPVPKLQPSQKPGEGWRFVQSQRGKAKEDHPHELTHCSVPVSCSVSGP